MYMNQTKAPCACGRVHQCDLEKTVIGSGAIRALTDELSRIGAKRVFLLADAHTYEAARGGARPHKGLGQRRRL